LGYHETALVEYTNKVAGAHGSGIAMSLCECDGGAAMLMGASRMAAESGGATGEAEVRGFIHVLR